MDFSLEFEAIYHFLHEFSNIGMHPIRPVTDSIIRVRSQTMKITRPGCHFGALNSIRHSNPV